MKNFLLMVIIVLSLSCGKSRLSESEFQENISRIKKSAHLNKPKYLYAGSDFDWHYLNFVVREKVLKQYKISKNDLLLLGEFEQTQDQTLWRIMMTRGENLYWDLMANEETMAQKYLPITSENGKEYILSLADFYRIKQKKDIRKRIEILNIPKIQFVKI